MTTVFSKGLIDVSFSSRARYKIFIRGYIDKSWSGRLGGLDISTTFTEDEKPLTILEGDIADQAALMGIINSVYDMHLPLLQVTIIKVYQE